MRIVDPNMDTALRWASELGPPPELPQSMTDVNQRARLVNDIEAPLISDSILYTLSYEEKSQRLKEVARISKNYTPEVDDDDNRVNITLRLWSGCLSSAKTIAPQTLGGPNTPEMRTLIFTEKIEPIAQVDPIYRAGVETAPSFKRLRNEDYSFDGVPENSAVRKYP